MAKSNTVKATLRDARAIKAVWEKNPNFSMGTIGLNEFLAVYVAADAMDKDCTTTSIHLTGQIASRDDKVRELRDLLTRFRSGMRSVYGPDSVQYEQAGGTRTSARRLSRPRPKAAQAAQPEKL